MASDQQQEKRRASRNPAEDAHYQGAREAHKTADQRRSIHQRTVESMEGGEPHVITHDQAEAILRSLGIDPPSLFEPHASTKKDAKAAAAENAAHSARGTLVGHVHQAEGGAVGKLVRHYMKWLRDPGTTTTIPLSAADLKALDKHQPKGKRLQRHQPEE
jgi:hypothetical protein